MLYPAISYYWKPEERFSSSDLLSKEFWSPVQSQKGDNANRFFQFKEKSNDEVVEALKMEVEKYFRAPKGKQKESSEIWDRKKILK